MKYLFCFLFLFSSTLSYSQIEKIEIDKQIYEFETQQYIDSEPRGGEKKILTLSRINSLGKTKILSHILKDKWGDGNSESLELGDYVLSDSVITFYSFWCRKGDAPVSPYGARIQKYKFENSKLKLIESQIYIETTAIYWLENKGVQFLFKKPETEVDKHEFFKYIFDVEKEYHAKFVFGKQSDRLIQKVKAHLKEPIQKETKDWFKYKNSFGVKL